jgi:hypothetical protein
VLDSYPGELRGANGEQRARQNPVAPTAGPRGSTLSVHKATMTSGHHD